MKQQCNIFWRKTLSKAFTKVYRIDILCSHEIKLFLGTSKELRKIAFSDNLINRFENYLVLQLKEWTLSRVIKSTAYFIYKKVYFRFKKHFVSIYSNCLFVSFVFNVLRRSLEKGLRDAYLSWHLTIVGNGIKNTVYATFSILSDDYILVGKIPSLYSTTTSLNA